MPPNYQQTAKERSMRTFTWGVLMALWLVLAYKQGCLDGTSRARKAAEEREEELRKVIRQQQSDLDGLWQRLRGRRDARFNPHNVT